MTARTLSALLGLIVACHGGADARSPTDPRASPAPDHDVRNFRLETPMPAELVSRARRGYRSDPLGLTRLPLMVTTKSCWRYSSACRAIGLNPEIVAQARALMSPGARLFLKTVQVIAKAPGSCQRLHTDMDMVSAQCADRDAASVWILARTAAPSPLRVSPFQLLRGSHSLGTTAEELLYERGCWSANEWTGCRQLDRRLRPECTTNATVAAAVARWPDARLRLVDGPRAPMEGVAWRARAWHQTRDEVGRIGILVQYATERCLRSLREVRRQVPVDGTDRWRGPDWFPFLPVPEPAPGGRGNQSARLDGAWSSPSRAAQVGAPAPPAPVGLDLPGPFDVLIFERDALGLARDAPAVQPGACRRTDMTRINVGKIVNHTVGVRAFHRALNFARRPSWIGNGGGVRTFELDSALTTRHLRVFKAYVAHWSAGGPWAHTPHNEALDSVCVVLSGEVECAQSFSGRCGSFAPYTTRLGDVDFRPHGVFHANAPAVAMGGSELCLQLSTWSASRSVGPSLSNGRLWPNGVLSAEERSAFVRLGVGVDALRATTNPPATGGPPLTDGRVVHTPIWSLLTSSANGPPLIGYSHLLTRALSLGRGGSTGDATAAQHDTLVVVLHGTATLEWAGADQLADGSPSNARTLTLAAGGFALVPAQTAVSYAARGAEGVDLLLVEVASASLPAYV